MDKKTPIEQQWKQGKLKDLCIDFDGVIHSYKSGWKGATVIPDEPVPGAIEWLVNLLDQGFQPCIYSSRSKTWFGRRAMKKWFVKWIIIKIENEQRSKYPEGTIGPYWFHYLLKLGDCMTPWEIWVRESSEAFVKKLKFPSKKPAAYLTIDDRAICFNGTFPTSEEMNNFKPWYKK